MDTQNNILSLLHDTCLEKIQFPEKNKLVFRFSFYLTNTTKYTVDLINEDVTNVSCTEFYKNNTSNTLDIISVKNIDCLQVEQNNCTINMIFENSDKDTIIKINYESKQTKVQGNIQELKIFWDIA